jgi:hypothetical protein
MDLLGLLPSSILAVGCASAVAAGVAKLTKNTTDDKWAAKLAWLHDKFAFLGLHPSMDVKKVGTAVLKGGMVVVDHRAKL